MTDEEAATRGPWPNGMLRCQAASQTKRLAIGDDGAFPRPRATEESLDMHVTLMVQPIMFDQARSSVDMRHEVERRVLFQLVEHGIKEHLWPIAPRIRWETYDAYGEGWRQFHWLPEPKPIRLTERDL